jgi:hypothetical protein
MQFQAVTDQRVNGLKFRPSLVLPVLTKECLFDFWAGRPS